MREIGGYLSLECGNRPLYHQGVYVNSGKNALRLIIRTLGIKRIHVPVFTCTSVYEAIASENCEMTLYDLGQDLLPSCEFPVDDFILYNDYFGVCGGKTCRLAARYPNLIVDNAQAFYAKSKGRATIYSPRKFFGLPDGGIAVGEGLDASDLPLDVSYDRMTHLLKRWDLGAEAGYADAKADSAKFVNAPIMRLSKLTMALMGNIDYEWIAMRRRENFDFLHQRLNSSFPFEIAVDDVPLVYPYWTENATDLRANLISKKIFVAKYWPGLGESGDRIANCILPLPIDQRYNRDDMQNVLDVIFAEL